MTANGNNHRLQCIAATQTLSPAQTNMTRAAPHSPPLSTLSRNGKGPRGLHRIICLHHANRRPPSPPISDAVRCRQWSEARLSTNIINNGSAMQPRVATDSPDRSRAPPRPADSPRAGRGPAACALLASRWTPLGPEREQRTRGPRGATPRHNEVLGTSRWDPNRSGATRGRLTRVLTLLWYPSLDNHRSPRRRMAMMITPMGTQGRLVNEVSLSSTHKSRN